MEQMVELLLADPNNVTLWLTRLHVLPGLGNSIHRHVVATRKMLAALTDAERLRWVDAQREHLQERNEGLALDEEQRRKLKILLEHGEKTPLGYALSKSSLPVIRDARLLNMISANAFPPNARTFYGDQP